MEQVRLTRGPRSHEIYIDGTPVAGAAGLDKDLVRLHTSGEQFYISRADYVTLEREWTPGEPMPVALIPPVRAAEAPARPLWSWIYPAPAP
jgi:hypothetical protein